MNLVVTGDLAGLCRMPDGGSTVVWGGTTPLMVGASAVGCALALIAGAGLVLWADANARNDFGYLSAPLLP